MPKCYQQEDWTELVEDCLLGGGRIFIVLERIFTPIARRIASQCVEDAVQAAIIKVWRRIDRVDLGQPTLIKAFVIKVGVRAMRDEIRRWLRGARVQPLTVDVSWERRDDGPTIPSSRMFDLYLEHIRDHGEFNGAHKAVAKKLGVSLSYASTLFHRECQRLGRTRIDPKIAIINSVLGSASSRRNRP